MARKCLGYKSGKHAPKGTSLYDRANLFSRLSLSWMRPIVHDSLKDKSFGISSLGPLEAKARSHTLYVALRRTRDRDVRAGRSLFRTIFSFIPRSYWCNTIPWLFFLVCEYSEPILLAAYLEHFETLKLDPESARGWWGWVMVALYVIIGLGMAILSQLNFVWSTHIGVRVRVAVTTLLYNKLLKLRESAKQTLSAGNLVNLMFMDTSRIATFVQYITVMIFLPVEVVVATFMMVRKLGALTALPVALLVVMFGFCMGMGRLMMRARTRVTAVADGRVRKTAEILGGIRVIKLFGDEDVFYRRILATRTREFRSLRSFSLSQQSMLVLVDIITPIICIAVFAAMRGTGMAISSATVYEITALLNILRGTFVFLPISIVSIQDFLVAVRRISALLSLPERTTGECDIRDAYGRPVEDWEKAVLEPGAAEVREGDGGEMDDIAISIPRPTSFTWATSADLAVPARIDENYDRKKIDAARARKVAAKETKRLCGARSVKEGKAWKTYTALVPRGCLTHTRHKKAKGPTTPEESSAFHAWLTAGMPSDPALVPHPAVPQALHPALVNIKLEIHRGETVAVCGRVGSGKTSLLNALLGELRVCRRADEFAPPEEGAAPVTGASLGITDPEPGAPVVSVRGSVAYCAQSAWIMNATVRDNIIFGQPFDQAWYNKVVDCCCLRPDLTQFVAGDQTEIGERGATLSGGQKHRIALARAVYSKADIYLLDDPLSAVDAHVGRRLFRDVIQGLLGDKTVVLATHQLQYVPRCDRVLRLRGRCVVEGETPGEEEEEEVVEEISESEGEESVSEDTAADEEAECDIADDAAKPDATPAKTNGQLVEEETSAVGRIKMKKIGQYLRAAGSPALSVAVGIALLAALALITVGDYMQAEWAAQPGTVAGERSFVIFAATQVAFVVAFFAAAYGLVLLLLRASRSIHMGVVRSVLSAPMAFFDATPSGRVLNRFSKDTDNADTLVPMYLSQFLLLLLYIIEMVIVIGIASPYVLIAVVVVYASYAAIFVRFRAAPRELRRLDSVSRSPVLSLTTETLGGAATVRAYQQEAAFTGLYLGRLDKNTSANTLYVLSMRWLSFRLDCVGVLLILTMSVLGLVLYNNPRIAVMLGAGLTYAFTVPMLTRETVANFVSAEAEFSSVERLLEFRDRLPKERPLHTSNAAPLPKEWPASGEVVFDNVAMRYRPGLPLVLRGVSFALRPGEKIGVVGRTGAGKTSITAALFQLYECEEGSRILLDGVDLTRLGLHDARRGLAIIPQDAFLFSGTLRENLDVANLLISEEAEAMGRRLAKMDANGRAQVYAKIARADGLAEKLISPEAMWDALEKCMLKEAFEARPGGLDFVLTDNGANLSAGERQLVCLAKALLRGSPVIVMDEATAQVDQASDSSVQKVIREAFRDRTILCIAHRLQTIIDFDRILVMDGGHVAELDTPANLLRTPGSIFASLVDETGPETAAMLRFMAMGDPSPATEEVSLEASASAVLAVSGGDESSQVSSTNGSKE